MSIYLKKNGTKLQHLMIARELLLAFFQTSSKSESTYHISEKYKMLDASSNLTQYGYP